MEVARSSHGRLDFDARDVSRTGGARLLLPLLAAAADDGDDHGDDYEDRRDRRHDDRDERPADEGLRACEGRVGVDFIRLEHTNPLRNQPTMAAEKIPGEFHQPSDAMDFYEYHMSDISPFMKGDMATYLNESNFYDADGLEITNAAKKTALEKKFGRSF